MRLAIVNLRIPVLAMLGGLLCTAAASHGRPILVEAESFTERGGWSLDTQFIHIMGSPYLLAHGLGQPVVDATTTVKFPEGAGSYRVFARTKDWVARWKAARDARQVSAHRRRHAACGHVRHGRRRLALAGWGDR